MLALVACARQSEPSSTLAYGTIDVVAADADNRHPVLVHVVDESKRLASARSASQAELRAELRDRPMEGAALGATRFDGSDRSVLLIWNGTGCDREASVVVARDVSALRVAAGSPSTCALPQTYRGVVLVFSSPVIVEAIRLEAG